MHSLSDRKRIVILVIIMTIISASIGGVAIYTLYDTSFEQQRSQLINTVTSHARLMEAVARFDQKHSLKMGELLPELRQDVEIRSFINNPKEYSIRQFQDAFYNYSGVGETDEITLGMHHQEQIQFLWRKDQKTLIQPKPVPFSSNLAEPMRLALSGKSGTVIGPDYKNEMVLAAFEPVAILNLGIVAKTNLTEIRAPFIRAGFIVLGISFVLIIVGTYFFLWVGNPIVNKVQRQKAFLKGILENIEDGIVACDENGTLTLFNKASRRMHGLAEEKIPPEEWGAYYSLFHADGTTPMQTAEIPLFRSLQGETISNLEMVIAPEGKEKIFLDAYSQPLFDDSGSKFGAVASMHDITARKQAENERDRFFNLSTDLFVIAGVDGFFKRINSSWSNVLGWSEQEILGKPYIEFVHPEDRELTNLEVAKQMDTGQASLSFMNRYRKKDGTYCWLEWVAVPGMDNQFYAVARDVTERLKAEKDLKDSKRQLELAQEMAHIGHWSYNLNSGQLTWSKEMFRIVRGDPEQKALYYDELKEIIHHEDWQLFDQASKACANGVSYNLELRFVFPDKSIRYIKTQGYPKILYNGTIPELFGLSQDITEQREAGELRLAKEIAEQASQAKSIFLASMSHDIRTPMNAILGMGEMLAESDLDADQRHYINIINHSGEGLLALINDILDLSKIEAGQLELEQIPFNPKKLVLYSVETLKSNAQNQGIGMVSHVDEHIPDQIIGDPSRLQQILFNLLSNALKFTSKGNITLSAFKTEEGVLSFSVSDTGIGIPKNKQKSIFQPFQQAESSTTSRFGGTGLGLSICYKLVHEMGGVIWVVSDPGEGSTFNVSIPYQEVTLAEQPQSLPDQSMDRGEQEECAAGLAILLADDSAENRMVIQAFCKNSPHRLTIVENGRQALEEFKTGNFDLILMDVHMPEMDGYEATKNIRKWEQKHNLTPIPVLAITANAMKDDIEKTRQSGCNLHLSKPIRKQLLLDTIRQFC